MRKTMCGRYSLAVDAVMFAEYFNMIIQGIDYTIRYNIAPSQPAPIISGIKGKNAFQNAVEIYAGLA